MAHRATTRRDPQQTAATTARVPARIQHQTAPPSPGGHTLDHAYHATIKASHRRQDDSTHYRIRIDRLDPKGKATRRRAGKMHQLGARAINARKRVLMLVDHSTITITELSTGEVLSQHLIQADTSYWPDQPKPQGRWPNE